MSRIGSLARRHRRKQKSTRAVDSRTTLRELDELIKRLQAAIEREAASLKALPQGSAHSASELRVREMRVKLGRLRRRRVATNATRRNPKTY
jgi:hypothetical protein